MCYTCVKYEAQNLYLVIFIKAIIVIGCGKGVGPTKKCESI